MKTAFIEEWNSYCREILYPAGAGEIQCIETRRAFYAGAAAMLGMVSRIAAAAPDEDAGAAVLEKLSGELRAYQQTVGTAAERGRP
jgi:hypothetical protein